MREFDLEAAKAGAAVCTKDGRNARIIAFDCKGCGRKPILALIDMGDWEQSASWTERGEIIEDFKDASDLMMRDDDYAEKLARGEYGPTVKEKLTVDNPTCKESLPVDREYWRRVYAGMAMAARIVATKSWCMNETVVGAVDMANALLAELETKKTEK